MKSIRILSPLFILAVALLLSVLVSSCNNDLYDCTKKSGKIIRIERKVAAFKGLRIEDNIDVVLFQDTSSVLVVEAGEQLISGIETTVSDCLLILKNTNSCNWIRNAKIPVRVFVPVNHFRNIDYKGYGNVLTIDTLHLAYIQIDARDGSGSFRLMLDVDSSFLNIHEGVTDITLTGKCDFNYIYNNGIGPVNTNAFDANAVVLHHKGPGNCYVKALKSLDVTIEYSGNIYYEGNPSFIKSVVSGSGKLIKVGK